MSNRKHRKSAVVLMMVAGGLAAAVPASDLALAQKPDSPSAMPGPTTLPPGGFKPQDTTGLPAVMPQGTTGILCNERKGGHIKERNKLRGTTDVPAVMPQGTTGILCNERKGGHIKERNKLRGTTDVPAVMPQGPQN